MNTFGFIIRAPLAALLIAATSLFAAGATASPAAQNIAQAGEDDSAELAKKLTNPLSDLG